MLVQLFARDAGTGQQLARPAMPTAMDEPYRRALTGMYARLAATLKELTGGEAARHAIAPQNPYKKAEDFCADLRTIEDSLHQPTTVVPWRPSGCTR